MKKLLAIPLAMCIILSSFSQSQKFDIASFTPPQGWQRLDSNGVLIFHDYKTKNNLTSFGQIILFPSRPATANATKNFTDEWDAKISKPTGNKTKPTTQTEKTPDGWTAVTGYANVSQSGLNYVSMLVTATGFGRTISVMANTAGSEHSSAIEKFFNDLELDSKAALALNKPGNNVSTMNGATSFSEYQFLAPQGWVVKNNGDHLSMSQSQIPGDACLLLVLTPQSSSGNLETDVNSVFDQMYKGWTARNTGERKYDLSKGYTEQGLEYAMLTASMSKLSADGSRYDGFEDGSAMVIKNGNKIAIIATRHNTTKLSHDECVKKYETLGRFFNSFSFRNATATANTDEAPSKRIIGVWKVVANGPAAGEYVFAANGTYGQGSGVGSSTSTRDDRYEHTKSNAYGADGDGKYSITGNQIKFQKRGESNPEVAKIRFEKINHGGTGWTDRIYLLKVGPDGKPYEACFEKPKPTR